jgi:hypothetical protein
MRKTSVLARWCVAVALLIGGTTASLAQSIESVDCSTGGNLATTIAALSNPPPGSSNVLTITGDCTGGPFTVNASNTQLVAGVGGATINGQIAVTAPGVLLTGLSNGLTIDGTGITLASSGSATGGVSVGGTAGVTITDCTIQNWRGNGVFVAPHANLSINGVTITSNTGAGLLVDSGTAALGESVILGNGLPVTISSNGTGINVIAGGSVTVVNGSIENNTVDGVDVFNHSSIVFSSDGGAGTAITGNGEFGINIEDGSNLTFVSGGVTNNGNYGIEVGGSSATIATIVIGLTPGPAPQITGNGAVIGGGVQLANSTILISGATITGNTGGPAIQATSSAATIGEATISSTAGQPAILAYGATLSFFSGNTLSGPTNASTLAALAGSKVTLLQSTVTADDPHDPTVFIADGSTLDSFGGNTICTGTLSGSCTAVGGGIAITVSNDSTFREVIGALNPIAFAGPVPADTITGAGTVEVQSNMELGTGATNPSSWTGAITVQQNSSFRLDGGISISGGVDVIQGSNGFFNKSNGGTNSVTITCAGTDSSHVAGPANVSPAVTLVAAGVGCYAF